MITACRIKTKRAKRIDNSHDGCLLLTVIGPIHPPFGSRRDALHSALPAATSVHRAVRGLGPVQRCAAYILFGGLSMRRLLLATIRVADVAPAAEPAAVDVRRDANCGCCTEWIKHLEADGFEVTDPVETNMSAVKAKLGVPHRLGSRHTRVIDGKFVEGHVPA